MTRILLVPDLPLEGWPSMDRYASRLAIHLPNQAEDLEIEMAGKVGGPTVDDRHLGARASEPVRKRLVPAPRLSELRRYVARYYRYPAAVRHKRGDLVHVLDHSYAHIMHDLERRPGLVTVHDLLPVMTVAKRGRSFREHIRNRFLRHVLDGLRQARAWIVATDWLKGELATWLGHADGIHVIPYGVDDAFFEPPPTSREDTRRRFGIPEDAFVILHVGSVGPRKNLPGVIAAVDGVRRAEVDAWFLQLGGALTAEHESALRDKRLERRVTRVGRATESDLRAAYHAADVLLFPSHYEGFGFPVLEAMASGLPVVTSGAGGLSEVAGDAAIVVGGRESEPYVRALVGLARDGEARRQLTERGHARARKFRWAETARRTAEVYRALL